MKKLSIFLAIALLFGFAALSEPVSEALVSMQGTVLEIDENGSYLIDTAELGEVLVQINEATFLETDREIAAGDFLYIDYDGRMSRSLPPQITASIVRMHCLTGAIAESYPEENAVLLQTDALGEVFVRLPDDWAGQEIAAESLTVYYNGAITMSLPGQISAGLALPLYSLQGAVTEIGEDFLILGEGTDAVQVNLADIEIPEDLNLGDIVRVLYNGQMTRSLPPQVTAMEIVQISR
ncbi:MAG: hypothetical protein ACI4MF_11280 [Candidatus Faecivicinus sp.]